MGAYEVQPPRVYYVDAAATGANTGATWADAFSDLQSALAVVQRNERVFVAGGTYRPTTGTDRNATFILRNGAEFYGGFAGRRNPGNPDARDIAAFPTVLSGDLGAPGDISDNAFHVVSGDNGGFTFTLLDGFTVTAGNASGAANPTGGGLLLNLNYVVARNATFLRNHADYGGAIASTRGTYLDHCQILGNSAATRGGALVIIEGGSGLFDCTFVGNSAPTGSVIDTLPSGDPFASPQLYVYRSTFAGNVGGATFSVPTTWLTNAVVWGNTGSTLAGTSTVQYSDVQGSVPAGPGNISQDPAFLSPPSPGADGVWGTPDDDYGNLVPAPSSPVVDAGSSASNGNSIYDLRGLPRVVDTPGVRDPGRIIDMGAYEVSVPLAPSSFELTAAALVLRFPANVSASLASGDVQFLPLSAGGPPVSATLAGYDAGTNTATFSTANLQPGGVYRAALMPSAVTDAYGNEVTGARLVDFALAFDGATTPLPAPGRTYAVDQLLVGPAATLDLGTSALTVRYPQSGTSPAAFIRALIASGADHGRWDGHGIVNSAAAADPARATAVGYYDDGASVRVAATWYGDANLDARVDADDAALLVLARTSGQTGWSAGDFNYDGAINADDTMLFSVGAAASAGRANPATPARTMAFSTASAAAADPLLSLIETPDPLGQ